MKQGLWQVGLILLAWLGLAAPAARADFYTPPDAAGINLAQIDAVRTAVSQHQLADAAKLVDAMLAQHGEELAQQDGTTWRTVAVLIAQAVQADASAFAAEYAKQFDAAAHEALQVMKVSRHDDPAALCSLAARYPFTPTAGQALAQAGRRAAEIGDLVAAQTLFAKAKLAGWPADADEQKLVDKIKSMSAGEGAIAGDHGEGAAYVGELPFDARWYQDGIGNGGKRNSPADLAALPEARCFPVSGGSLIFIQTAKHLLALKPNGGTAWSAALLEPDANASQKKPPPDAPNRPVMVGPATLLPAVLAQDGVAELVAVKVAVPEQGATVVRCFRAIGDRVELWNTGNQETLADLVFQGSPLICGSYTYLVAQQATGPQNTLLLLALDTTTGREFWRANLGSVAAALPNGGKALVKGQEGRNALADEPSLAVADDLVIATPGVGHAIAVNRFTGKLRWLSKYGRLEGSPLRQIRYYSRAVISGGVAVLAPIDSPRLLGLDTDNGNMLWEAQIGEGILCGGSDDCVALATNRGLVALDSRTGTPRKWVYKPTVGAVTGPCVVVGHVALVPVAGQMAAVALADGQPTLVPPKVPLMTALLAPEGNRAALQADGILVNFGQPAGMLHPPPRKD